MEIKTLQCLNKYLFKDRKYNNILERDALNIYIYVENEDCEPLF